MIGVSTFVLYPLNVNKFKYFLTLKVRAFAFVLLYINFSVVHCDSSLYPFIDAFYA